MLSLQAYVVLIAAPTGDVKEELACAPLAGPEIAVTS